MSPDSSNFMRFRANEDLGVFVAFRNVLTEYFLLWGRFWPRTIFFAVYLIMSLIFSIILISLDLFYILKIYIVISILVSIIIASLEIRRELKALPWKEN